MAIFIFIVIGGALIFINLNLEKNGKIKQQEKEEHNRKHKEEYGIPEDASLLCCTNIVSNGITLENNWNVFVWKDNNILKFCGTNDCYDIREISIPIDNVKFYTRKGDCRIETVTEGGGISIGNAIIGGIFGLIIGAIIGVFILGGISVFVGLLSGVFLAGKRKITTISKEIDYRKTYLNYLEYNKSKQMVFTSKDYEVLLKLIPEKEASYIGNSKNLESDKPQNNNVYKDIEALAKLRDKDILTENEFNNKKQLLLDKIQ